MFHYFRGTPNVIAELDTLGFSRLVLSSVTVGETYYGIKKGEKRKTKELIGRFGIYHTDKNVSKRFLHLMYEHGQAMSIPDGLIAATALEMGVELYTYNSKDFDFIDGLRLYKPQAFLLNE